MIQKEIIDEIKMTAMHSISADEVTASNDEILSICMRYVNQNKEMTEVFLEFLSLERITGEHIGNTLLEFYKNVDIAVSECRGQC